MINSMFSIFDPSSSILVSNSTFTLALLILFVPTVSRLSNNITQLQDTILANMSQEVNQASTQINGNVIISITLFFVLLYTNVIALYPQNFANSAQITFSLTLSLLLWMSSFSYATVNNTTNFLQHLVPQGTPVALINFMVLIELISNLIRPITLCVRLTANILAGHLLISLLSNFLISINPSSFFVMSIIPFILTGLESAVSLIQAYVFITLVTLYSNETK